MAKYQPLKKEKKFEGNTYRLIMVERMSKAEANKLITKAKNGTSMGIGKWKYTRKVKVPGGWTVYGRKR